MNWSVFSQYFLILSCNNCIAFYVSVASDPTIPLMSLPFHRFGVAVSTSILACRSPAPSNAFKSETVPPAVPPRACLRTMLQCSVCRIWPLFPPERPSLLGLARKKTSPTAFFSFPCQFSGPRLHHHLAKADGPEYKQTHHECIGLLICL